MSRYRRSKRGDTEDIESRLEAVRRSPHKNRRKRSNIGPTIFGILVVVGIIGVIYLIYTSVTGGQNEASRKTVTVTVKRGDTLSSVAEKLDRSGVIPSAFTFKLQARFEGESAEIKPGSYRFQRGESTGKILKTLTANRPAPTFSIVIPEGLTLKQTAQEVARQSDISEKSFEKAARKTDYSYAFLNHPQIKTTEGFLFPKKYDFKKGATARQVVDRLLDQYLIETQNLDLPQAEKRLNLSEYQILTVASLIERESANPRERPIIASVIYNRLHKGMPLQIDATVQYALGKPKAELSLKDLKVNSPYNTYEHKGLPPGPIDSPSLDSIKAAANPAKTDYLYYVLKKNGKEHYFTSNYQDFLRAKAKAGR